MQGNRKVDVRRLGADGINCLVEPHEMAAAFTDSPQLYEATMPLGLKHLQKNPSSSVITRDDEIFVSNEAKEEVLYPQCRLGCGRGPARASCGH